MNNEQAIEKIEEVLENIEEALEKIEELREFFSVEKQNKGYYCTHVYGENIKHRTEKDVLCYDVTYEDANIIVEVDGCDTFVNYKNGERT